MKNINASEKPVNLIKSDFIDELKVQGVNFKGYGILPKYVMLDPDLTLEAKGIYAYFCSYAGAGNTAFPSRDKIVADLQINKDTYYKHFNIITSQGYIAVQQLHRHGGRGAGFTKNIYTLVVNPKKFEDKPEDIKNNQAYVRIRFNGLTAAGYGFIPKSVMVDSRLPLKAKAIYAYFCSFSGSGNTAFPKRERILFHLGVSKPTYDNFYRLLTELNYITAVQRHINGKLSVNDYCLNQMPDEIKAAKKSVITIQPQGVSFSDTQKQGIKQTQRVNSSDTQKQDTQKQDTQISDINNNNIKRNNIKINQSINQPAAQPEMIERWIDCEYIKKIEEELYEAGTLPYSFLANDKKLTAAIRILTDWNMRSDETKYTGEDCALNYSSYMLFVEAIIEMLTARKETMKLKGVIVTYEKVHDRLTQYIEKGNSPFGKYITIGELLAVATGDFKKACQDTTIKNHLQYMKACIWNAMQTGNVAMEATIKHDFG